MPELLKVSLRGSTSSKSFRKPQRICFFLLKVWSSDNLTSHIFFRLVKVVFFFPTSVPMFMTKKENLTNLRTIARLGVLRASKIHGPFPLPSCSLTRGIAGFVMMVSCLPGAFRFSFNDFFWETGDVVV